MPRPAQSRLTPTGPDRAAPPWLDGVRDRLSARLEADSDRPLALALSGGGDSIALLRAAADWARERRRPLLALTVDHGLNPDSARWTAFARDAAVAAGARWKGLVWTEPKPSAGLPAAARAARHRLIAGAARAAGARIILFAHTADDAAEGEWMRAGGSTLGRVRDWSPSPAWPEGRGLMLLRPMLDVRRGDLRDWLEGQGAAWIDDPANEDLHYARVRARASLAGAAPPAPPAPPAPTAPTGSLPVSLGEGAFAVDRAIPAGVLAVTLVCAGGGDRPPRGDRLDRMIRRLRAGERFTAALCGARVEAGPARVLVSREAGEYARRPLPHLPLPPGVETVWDGRWAVTAAEPGLRLVPSAGRMTALPPADRARLKSLPPAARGSLPVLVRDDGTAPVLAGTGVRTRSLVEQRLALALDRMTHETDLEPRAHGATRRNPLFSGADFTEQGRAPRSQGSRRV